MILDKLIHRPIGPTVSLQSLYNTFGWRIFSLGNWMSCFSSHKLPVSPIKKAVPFSLFWIFYFQSFSTMHFEISCAKSNWSQTIIHVESILCAIWLWRVWRFLLQPSHDVTERRLISAEQSILTLYLSGTISNKKLADGSTIENDIHCECFHFVLGSVKKETRVYFVHETSHLLAGAAPVPV